MFGLRKKSFPAEENKNDSSNSNQQKDFDIEKIPIHTMREDLENLKNPDFNVSHGTISPSQEKKPAINQEAFTQKQRNSPFLNLDNRYLPKNENSTNEKPILKTENIPAKVDFDSDKRNNYTESPPLTKSRPISMINRRLIFFPVSAFVLAAIIISAGYYFSKNKIDLSGLLKNLFPAKEIATPENIPPIEIPVEKPIEKPTLSYSQTNPNYLRLENTDSDTEKVKTALQQYIQKVFQEGYTAPIEFVATDQQNAPLAFNDFATKIGLKLSEQVMKNLGSNFSLFIYNDVSVSRIGLSIDLSMESKDNDKLAKTLLQEENTLADKLSPLFFYDGL